MRHDKKMNGKSRRDDNGAIVAAKRDALRAASALTPSASLVALALASFLGISTPVFAATVTWTGSTSTDWLTGSNWDTGLPTSADFAYVNSGTVVLNASTDASRLYVYGGTLTINGSLTTSSAQFFYGGTTTIDGTNKAARFSISGTNGLASIYGNGTLIISGTAGTSNVLFGNNTLVSPGHAGEIGTLTIQVENPSETSSAFAARFQRGTTYVVEVGANSSDIINVGGLVDIVTGAELQIVSYGAPSSYASTYTILTGTSISGTFSSVSLSDELAGYQVVYTSTSVTLVQAEAPTEAPTQAPTEAPTQAPTEAPTQAPTEAPTQAPTEAPTQAPTEAPTQAPTEAPTQAPTEAPTQAPTEAPTQAPTEAPTQAPTEAPTQAPTEAPTQAPIDNSTLSPNQSSVVSALQSPGAPPAVLSTVSALPSTEQGAALQQLSGDVHASAQTAIIQSASAVNTVISTRIGAGFTPTAPSAPSVQALGYGEERRAVKDDRFAAYERKAETFDPGRFAVWGQGFGSWGKIDGTNGVSDTDIASGGFLVGTDGLVTDTLRLGVFGGYSRSSFDATNFDGNSDNYHLGVYAGTQLGALSFRSGLSYTWHDMETTRAVPALGQVLSGKYDAGSFNAFGEAGYRFDLGKAAFEPFVNLAHTSMKTDGFTETGGAAALTIDGQTVNTTFTTLGLRASTAFDVGGIAAVARGTLGWRHAFGDTDLLSRARFAAGGDSFATTGTPIDKNTALVEAGLDFTVTRQATFGLTYTGQFGSNAYEHGFDAKLRVKF